ncbi:mago nashi [Aphelenchoides avenae]|nr:mago nashi [Aphelenchus avenae]
MTTRTTKKKNDTLIRREAYVSPIMEELRRIIDDSAKSMKEDNSNWPEPDRVGCQALEVVNGDEHLSFTIMYH